MEMIEFSFLFLVYFCFWFIFVFGLFLYKTIEFTVASGHIPTHEIWVYKWYEVFVEILYRHNVVGEYTYFIYTKMGGGM